MRGFEFRSLAIDFPSRARLLGLAYLLALVPGLLLASKQPLWSRVDEAQHYDAVAQYAHAVLPVEGRTTIRPETLAVMRAGQIYRWAPAGTEPDPAVTLADKFTAIPSYLTGDVRALWIRRHLFWFSYEAMQPPLYYALGAPVWTLGQGLGGPLGAAFALRFLNAALLAALVPLTLIAGRLLVPGRPGPAIAAAIGVATLPGLVLNGSAVTNDTMAAVMGAATFIVALLGLKRGWSIRLAVAAGLLFGLGLLTKLTIAGLGPMLAAAILWPALQRRAGLGRQLALGAVAAAATLALLTPWLLLNLHTYGQPLPKGPALELLTSYFPGVPLSKRFLYNSFRHGFETFWTGEPPEALPFAGVLVVLGAVWTAIALVGLVRLLRGRAALRPVAGTVPVALIGVAGAVLWALASLRLSHLGTFIPGRYVYPAVVPALLLLGLGAWEALRRRPARLVLVLAVAGFSALNLAAYANGATGLRLPPRLEQPPATAEIQTAGGSAAVGDFHITIDQVAVDRPAKRYWAHIRADNAAGTDAEWWPAPGLFIGQRGTVADYAESTRLPALVPAHSSLGGWVVWDPLPTAFDTAAQQSIIFDGIATDGYRHTEPVAVPVLAGGG